MVFNKKYEILILRLEKKYTNKDVTGKIME